MAIKKDLILGVGANLRELEAAFREIENKTTKLERKLAAKRKARLRTVGFAAAAAAAGVSAALKEFSQYESALVGMARTTGLAGDELADFTRRIDDVSQRLNKPREELFKIAEVAGTLGIKGSANLAKFTETMAKFDVASATLRGDAAANSIARIINLTGGGIQNVDRFASEIAYLADNFSATEAEIASISEELSRINAKIPLSTQNTIALSAAFAQLGISPEIVRTGLSKFSSALDKALRDGGEELRIFSALTGMTRDDLQKTFLEAPEKVFTAFSEGLGKTGNDASYVLSQLGLDQDRLAGIFLASAKNSDVLTAAIQQGNEEYERNTKLNEETAKVLDTTASKWEGLKVSIGNVVSELGEKLAPAANVVFDGLSAGFDALYKDLNDDIPAAFNALGTIIKGLATIVVETFNLAIGKMQEFASNTLMLAARTTQKLGLDGTSIRLGEKALELQASADFRLDQADDFFNPEAPDLREQYEAQEEALREHLANKNQIKLEAEEEARDQGLSEDVFSMGEDEFEESLGTFSNRLQSMNDIEAQALKDRLDNAETEAARRKILEGEIVNAKTARYKAEADLDQAIADSAFDSLNAIVGDNKAARTALFIAEKAFAIGQILINAKKAAALALATVPPPYGEAIAAERMATGVSMAASAAATAVPQLISAFAAQDGGRVPGAGRGDRPFGFLEPGEIVIPRRLSPTFEQLFGNFPDPAKGMAPAGMGQHVTVDISLNEEAGRLITARQRENRRLGITG